MVSVWLYLHLYPTLILLFNSLTQQLRVIKQMHRGTGVNQVASELETGDIALLPSGNRCWARCHTVANTWLAQWSTTENNHCQVKRKKNVVSFSRHFFDSFRDVLQAVKAEISADEFICRYNRLLCPFMCFYWYEQEHCKFPSLIKEITGK